jgi:uncharacterized protein (TIGR00369 family)
MTVFEPRNRDFAAAVRDSFERQPFMALMGAELISVTPGACEIGLDHRPELTQQHGFIHGGAIGAIIDSAMGYAGYTLIEADSTALTVEYKLNLVAPADGMRLVARGAVARAGRTLIVSRGEVFAVRDGEETLCAVATQTLMVLADRADKPA